LKLYVICPRCGAKILIQSTAKVRGELPYSFELICNLGHKEIYNSHNVLAGPELGKVQGGIIIGGLLGAVIGGPLGAVLGGIILGGAGASTDNTEKEAVARFNTS